MPMFSRRSHNLPIFFLVISLLISPAATSGHAWGAAGESRSFWQEGLSGAWLPDNCIENPTYRWGNSPIRQGYHPVGPFAGMAPTTFLAQFPLPGRSLNARRVINPHPRISDYILHHRTIVLLI